MLPSSAPPAATGQVLCRVNTDPALLAAAPPEAGCVATHCGLSEDFHLNMDVCPSDTAVRLEKATGGKKKALSCQERLLLSGGVAVVTPGDCEPEERIWTAGFSGSQVQSK